MMPFGPQVSGGFLTLSRFQLRVGTGQNHQRNDIRGVDDIILSRQVLVHMSRSPGPYA